MGNPFVKTSTDHAIGFCALNGATLKGEGIRTAPDETICLGCAEEITRLVLARDGKVTVSAEFKSNPVKYLTDRGFIDAKGRVRKELLEEAGIPHLVN